jgi:hypothetical protein
MLNVVVPWGATTSVLALCFETTRAPYLIGVGADDPRPDLEGPWREGNSTRTAHRSDLLLVLADRVDLPDLEVIDAWVEAIVRDEAPDRVRLELQMAVYVDAGSTDQIVFPFHRCRGSIEIPAWGWRDAPVVTMRTSSSNAQAGSDELTLHASAMIRVQANGICPRPSVSPGPEDALARLELTPSRSPTSVGGRR